MQKHTLVDDRNQDGAEWLHFLVALRTANSSVD